MIGRTVLLGGWLVLLQPSDDAARKAEKLLDSVHAREFKRLETQASSYLALGPTRIKLDPSADGTSAQAIASKIDDLLAAKQLKAGTWSVEFQSASGRDYRLLGQGGVKAGGTGYVILVSPDVLRDDTALEVALQTRPVALFGRDAGSDEMIKIRIVGGSADFMVGGTPDVGVVDGSVHGSGLGALRGGLGPTNKCPVAREQDAVVRLFYPPHSQRRACSGVLIAPGLVVTAAHCVDEMPNEVKVGACLWDQESHPILGCELRAGTFKSELGADIQCNYKARRISPDAVIHGQDVALLRLGTPVEPARALPRPVVIADKSGTIRSQAQLSIVGFGMVEYSPTFSEAHLADIRQQMGATVLGLPKNVATFLELQARPSSPSARVPHFGAMFGDSGGGVFMGPDSTGFLLAVLNTGQNAAGKSRATPTFALTDGDGIGGWIYAALGREDTVVKTIGGVEVLFWCPRGAKPEDRHRACA